MPSTSVACKAPSDCSEGDLRDFHDLVRLGGEVNEKTLPGLIRGARILGFLYDDSGSLIGTGAIKCPYASHRKKVFACASSMQAPNQFLVEAGWFFIHKNWRGKRLLQKLIEPLCAAVNEGIYATCRETNERMHRGLIRQGFNCEGESWLSDNEEYRLHLFIRSRL